MYERTLASGETLTFGHEGILYENSFVMYDHSSESLWIHVTGEAIKGKRKGTKLKFFPSTLTTWKSWKAMHPETQVLGGERAAGFMGAFSGFQASQRAQYGLAVFAPGKARLYPYRVLAKQRVVNDRLGTLPVVVAFSPEARVVRAFERRLAEEELTFESVDLSAEEDGLFFTDRETRSFWDGRLGAAVDGLHQGEPLRPLVCYPILIDRFHAFYPEGDVYPGDPPGE